MKKMMHYLSVTAILFVTASVAVAGPQNMPPVKTSPALDKIKALVGTWKGTGGDMGDGTVEVQYRLSSGGTAVVETISPGTPHEMTTVYFDEGGKLAMTHYCMLGNHPTMELKKESATEIELAESDKTHLGKEPHMDALAITFVNPNSIEQKWTMNEPGKPLQSTVFKLTRQS